MPARAYADTLPAFRHDLLTRLAAGEHASDICAAPGAPSYASVYGWARREPDFAAALARARTQGAARRRWAFDEARAEALLVRLRAGEPITAILRDPDMPSRRVYARWRATQSPFQEEIARLNAASRAARTGRSLNPLRPFDQALADRIVARVAAGETLQRMLHSRERLPSRNVIIRWRKMCTDFDRGLALAIRIGRRRARAEARCRPAVLAAVVGGLRRGYSLAALSGRRGVPCKTTLYAWMRTRPDFAAHVAQARLDRDLALADRLLILTETPEGMAANRGEVARLRRRLSGV